MQATKHGVKLLDLQVFVVKSADQLTWVRLGVAGKLKFAGANRNLWERRTRRD
jgi:hypothetical protein